MRRVLERLRAANNYQYTLGAFKSTEAHNVGTTFVVMTSMEALVLCSRQAESLLWNASERDETEVVIKAVRKLLCKLSDLDHRRAPSRGADD